MNKTPSPPLNNQITTERVSWVWHNYFSSLDQWLQQVVPVNVAALEARIAALEAQMLVVQGEIDTLQAEMLTAQADINTLQAEMLTAQADINTLQAEMLVVQADIVTLKSQMATAQAEINALQSDVLRLEPGYGGIRKTTPQTIGTLSAAYVGITNYQEISYSFPNGVTANLANGTVFVNDIGDYNLIINSSITFDAVANGGRTFGLRLFDTTNSTVALSTTIFVGKDAEGSTSSIIVPAKILNVNHVFRLEVGNASANFTNFAVNGVNFALNKLSAQ